MVPSKVTIIDSGNIFHPSKFTPAQQPQSLEYKRKERKEMSDIARMWNHYNSYNC